MVDQALTFASLRPGQADLGALDSALDAVQRVAGQCRLARRRDAARDTEDKAGDSSDPGEARPGGGCLDENAAGVAGRRRCQLGQSLRGLEHQPSPERCCELRPHGDRLDVAEQGDDAGELAELGRRVPSCGTSVDQSGELLGILAGACSTDHHSCFRRGWLGPARESHHPTLASAAPTTHRGPGVTHSRKVWVSSDTLGHELGEIAHRTQLQLLDGTFRTPERLGGLGDRIAVEEAQDKAFLLLRREFLHGGM